MVFHGLINYRYALNDWRHDVVPAVWCIDSHPSNSRHPFFQPNCKSIMVMPMIVKEFDNFFSDQVAVFCPNFVQNCEFRFLSKMKNFVISFVFCPKWIPCVPKNKSVPTRTTNPKQSQNRVHHAASIEGQISFHCEVCLYQCTMANITEFLQGRTPDNTALQWSVLAKFHYCDLRPSLQKDLKICPKIV